MTVVGRVAALFRYPVKSMAPEELDGVEVAWHGLAGDRRWAFIRAGQVRSGFPWLTIRQRPELARYRPRFAEPDRPDASQTLVRTPSGAELDVADPALAAELGPGVRVIKQDRGVFDTMPLSLLSTQTLACLGRMVGAGPDGRAVPAQPRGGCPGRRVPRGRVGRPGAARGRAADAGGPARPAVRDRDHRPGDAAPEPGGPACHSAGTRQAARGIRVDRGTRPDRGGQPGRTRTLTSGGVLRPAQLRPTAQRHRCHNDAHQTTSLPQRRRSLARLSGSPSAAAARRAQPSGLKFVSSVD